jgi:YidC/Oxa1 family membrane protein insertase
MEMRRLLLALVLSLLVWNFFQALLHPPRSRTQPKEPQTRPVPTHDVASRIDKRSEASAAIPQLVTQTPILVHRSDVKERRIEIETPEVVVAFTNRGARLVSWKLKKYKDKDGRHLELIHVPATGPRPLDVETGQPQLNDRLNEALFLADDERVVVRADQTGRLVLNYADSIVRARKSIELHGDSYMAQMLGATEPRVVARLGKNVERYPVKKIRDETKPLRGWSWAGIESAYFAALFIDPGNNGDGEAFAIEGRGDSEKKQFEAGLRVKMSGNPVNLYVGPKDYHILAKLDHDLKLVVPVGDWIGPIVVPLLKLLRWAHGRMGNYGWAIVLLTVLINAIMAPLRHFGFVNSAKMAKISPEMRAIQDRYRKYSALDPKRQEMQKELGALYRRHGMSMEGQMLMGCLPLLLTMPFLIAFYRVLQVSIDLRGAPFLWISDLSQKDPLYLTPIMMGASMLIMQSMTPSTVDATQRRMMMIMPLIFVVMFFAAPAGLNLYWLSSNLCAIFQQALTLQFLRRRETVRGTKARRR